jgi:ureidoglycolate lyase
MAVLQGSVWQDCLQIRIEQVEVLPMMIIRPKPLTKDLFLPYGDVLETDDFEPSSINFGNTLKFDKLAEVTHDGGYAQISIYRSSAIVLPFRVRLMECHPLGSQAFYPLHHRPFPVVVARAGEAPGATDLRIFLSNGRQGVNLHAGTWHHYQLTLGQDSDYLVIDRGGPEHNYQEHHLREEVWMDI